MVEKKEVEHAHHEGSRKMKVVNFFKNKTNVWMSVAILLGVMLFIIGMYSMAHSVSAKKAGQILADFAESQGVTFNVTEVKSEGAFYAVTGEIQGQAGTFYVTKDGKYFTSSILALESVKSSDTSSTDTQTAIEVPKSDRPTVELYIWGYCPYGVQAQGPLAQVAQLLKANADFEIVPYYDGHGAYETQQNKIQSCIQKLAKDKYWSYAAKFVSDVYPACSSTRTEECDKTESVKVMKSLGIDSTQIMSCVASDGASLFQAASAKAQQNEVQGSPTLIINGVQANVARSAEAYKTAVCSAFNNAPEACSTTLSSSSATSSGNC